MFARSMSLAIAGLAAVSLAACGGDDKDPTILNTEKVERAIEQSALTQRKVKVQVSCPDGVHQKKGTAFVCTATDSKGRTSNVDVQQQDDAGNVTFVVR